MGANMARRLKDCGFDVSVVYDVNKKAANALAKEIEREEAANERVRAAAGDGHDGMRRVQSTGCAW